MVERPSEILSKYVSNVNCKKLVERRIIEAGLRFHKPKRNAFIAHVT
jgi:hypothetical protein